MKITVIDEIKKACPDFVGAAVYAKVTNTEYDAGLWQEINDFS